jgi:integrase
MRERIRVKHYSIRTEETYLHWVKRYILFHKKRHPVDMGALEVEAFLSHLATTANVSASTQNLALSSILFLYKEVLMVDLPWLEGVTRAKKPRRLPVVLFARGGASGVGAHGGDISPDGIPDVRHGYAPDGVRALRVKDVDFVRHEILVREGKGNKDRVTMLPVSLVPALQAHLEKVQRLHAQDLEAGLVRRICHMPCRRNIRKRLQTGVGSMYSRPASVPAIRGRMPCGGIMSASKPISAPSSRRCGRQRLPSRRPAIRFVILLPRICWSPVMISARCRSCWAMRMWRRRRFIRMC